MGFKPEEFTADGSEYLELLELTAMASNPSSRSSPVPELNAYRMVSTSIRHGLLKTLATALDSEKASAWFSDQVLAFARESMRRALDDMPMEKLCSMAGDTELPDSLMEMVNEALDRASEAVAMKQEHADFIGRMPITPRQSHCYSITFPRSPRIRFMPEETRPSRRPRNMTPVDMTGSSWPPGRYSINRSGIRMNKKARDVRQAQRHMTTRRRHRH